MKLSTLSFTALSILSVAALPAITPNEEGPTLNKRGSEVNYLANCQAPYTVSHAVWYPDVDNSQNGQYPGSISNEYRDWSKGGDYLVWEGQQQDIYYADSGVTLYTHINSNGASVGFTNYAGWAQRNSDWKVFTCYRDNNRQLFSSGGLTCQSIYYCL